MSIHTNQEMLPPGASYIRAVEEAEKTKYEIQAKSELHAKINSLKQDFAEIIATLGRVCWM